MDSLIESFSPGSPPFLPTIQMQRTIGQLKIVFFFLTLFGCVCVQGVALPLSHDIWNSCSTLQKEVQK